MFDPSVYTQSPPPLVERPVSCKPLGSFFTPSDWTRHDCTPAASIRKWQIAAGEPGIPATPPPALILTPAFQIFNLSFSSNVRHIAKPGRFQAGLRNLGNAGQRT